MAEPRANAAFLILTSLATGPKHGYAMVSDIAAFSGTELGPGTLYTALQRLEADDLIAPVSSDDRRRPYRITPTGLATLQALSADMRRLTAVAARRLATR